MTINDNYYMKRIREESWAKNARLIKEPNQIQGRKVVRGLYFVKDSVTILGSGETPDNAIKDAYNGLISLGQLTK